MQWSMTFDLIQRWRDGTTLATSMLSTGDISVHTCFYNLTFSGMWENNSNISVKCVVAPINATVDLQPLDNFNNSRIK